MCSQANTWHGKRLPRGIKIYQSYKQWESGLKNGVSAGNCKIISVYGITDLCQPEKVSIGTKGPTALSVPSSEIIVLSHI